MMYILILLIAAHFLCDYPLQGNFLAEGKHPVRSPYCGHPWWYLMSAHCGIHAGAVTLITDSAALGIVEFVIHFCTDYFKCRGWITLTTDQVVHILCSFVVLIYKGVAP